MAAIFAAALAFCSIGTTSASANLPARFTGTRDEIGRVLPALSTILYLREATGVGENLPLGVLVALSLVLVAGLTGRSRDRPRFRLASMVPALNWGVPIRASV
jgi:hypothetical protein